MCAIFGSFDPSMWEILYEANKQRGNFASSLVCLTHDDQFIFKKEGDIDFDKIKYGKNTEYIVGHVQAATSSKRIWSYETSHPFESLSWLVFHNGVLTNEKQIRQHYLPFIENPVDTALIVNLIQFFTDNNTNTPSPVDAIRQTLELIQGTYALCIVDSDTNEVYIARSGSILHYDDKGNYSTLPGSNYKELPEGVIMNLDKKKRKWKKVGSFKHKSPYIFL